MLYCSEVQFSPIQSSTNKSSKVQAIVKKKYKITHFLLHIMGSMTRNTEAYDENMLYINVFCFIDTIAPFDR